MQIGSKRVLVDRRKMLGELFALGVGMGAKKGDDLLHLRREVLD